MQRVPESGVLSCKVCGNKLAHLLAKHAASIVDYIAWIEEVPYFLKQTLIYDVTSNLHTCIKILSFL